MDLAHSLGVGFGRAQTDCNSCCKSPLIFFLLSNIGPKNHQHYFKVYLREPYNLEP